MLTMKGTKGSPNPKTELLSHGVLRATNGTCDPLRLLKALECSGIAAWPDILTAAASFPVKLHHFDICKLVSDWTSCLHSFSIQLPCLEGGLINIPAYLLPFINTTRHSLLDIIHSRMLCKRDNRLHA